MPISHAINIAIGLEPVKSLNSVKYVTKILLIMIPNCIAIAGDYRQFCSQIPLHFPNERNCNNRLVCAFLDGSCHGLPRSA